MSVIGFQRYLENMTVLMLIIGRDYSLADGQTETLQIFGVLCEDASLSDHADIRHTKLSVNDSLIHKA